MCPMCSDAEEIDPDNAQICKRLADTTDSVNKWDRQCKLSKLHWTARKKMGDIPSTGIGRQKKKSLFFIQSQQKAFLLTL